MKRSLGLLLALVVLVLASVAHAYSGAGQELGTQNVKWLNRAGTAYQDTITLLSADTLRTEPISAANWDWSSLSGQNVTAFVPTNIAKIAFYSTITQVAANAVGDSVYYGVETSYDGGVNWSNTTYQPAVPLGTYAGAVGNCALATNVLWRGDTGAIFYEGYLTADKDNTALVPAPHNNLYAVPMFRLLVHGDISSTAQAIGGCKITITPIVPHVVQ